MTVLTNWQLELEAYLWDRLPDGWRNAVASDDDAAVLACRRDLDTAAFIAELGRAGWIAPHWDAAYGGRGYDRDTASEVRAFLDRWEVPRLPRGSGLLLAAPTILEWSSEETKRRLLPPIVSGEERWCQLFSEPGAGSDLASLATTAVRDGDEWVINGQKVWTTLGHESEFAMLLTRTDPTQPKRQGITYFGLDLKLPGVEVRPMRNMAGRAEFNEVFLSDVRVPDLYRISPEGEGWRAALTTLGAERYALSGGTRKKRKASDEILGGKTFVEVLTPARSLGSSGDPVWRQRLVGEWGKPRILRMTAQRAKASGSGPEGSVTKIAKAQSNQSLQVLAVDLLGARGGAYGTDDLDTDGFIEQFLRTRANSIEGGTSEIQRNIVGERVLGLPREPDPYHDAPWRDVPRS